MAAGKNPGIKSELTIPLAWVILKTLKTLEVKKKTQVEFSNQEMLKEIEENFDAFDFSKLDYVKDLTNSGEVLWKYEFRWALKFLKDLEYITSKNHGKYWQSFDGEQFLFLNLLDDQKAIRKLKRKFNELNRVKRQTG